MPLDGRYDFWAHAAVGRWIWTNGHIPTEGLFIWSAPHFPWIAHSWLSQLILYGVMELGGPLGVMAFNSLLTCVAFLLVWRIWVSRYPASVVTVMLFLAGIWVSAPRFKPRQELFTAIILVLLLAWLADWNQRRVDREYESAPLRALVGPPAFGLVVLFALWINLHALVVMGLLIVAVTAAADAAQYHFDRRARALLLLTVLCFAATLLNPWGWNYWGAAAVLKSGSQATYVDEWKPFWEGPNKLDLTYVVFEAGLVLAAIWGWVRNPDRRWAEMFWVALTAVLFIRSRRMLWLLALVCLVVVAVNARSFDTRTLWQSWKKFTKQPAGVDIPGPLRRVAHIGAIVILVTWVAVATGRFFEERQDYWPPQGISSNSPVKPANILAQRRLPGRIFNDYETSSYLQWRFNGIDPKTGRVPASGQRPLFIDLLNAYPDSVMNDYFVILAAKKPGQKLLDKLGVNTILLGEHHRKDELVKYLNKSAQWRTLYKGKQGFLWTRVRPLPIPRPVAKPPVPKRLAPGRPAVKRTAENRAAA
jgi:hypothetical protein